MCKGKERGKKLVRGKKVLGAGLPVCKGKERGIEGEGWVWKEGDEEGGRGARGRGVERRATGPHAMPHAFSLSLSLSLCVSPSRVVTEEFTLETGCLSSSRFVSETRRSETERGKERRREGGAYECLRVLADM